MSWKPISTHPRGNDRKRFVASGLSKFGGRWYSDAYYDPSMKRLIYDSWTTRSPDLWMEAPGPQKFTISGQRVVSKEFLIEAMSEDEARAKVQANGWEITGVERCAALEA